VEDNYLTLDEDDGGSDPANCSEIDSIGGGVGIQGVQLAKAMGMRPIVVDTSLSKKKLDLKMGSEAFIDFREVKNVAEEVKKIGGGVGAHGVFVTAPQGYRDAISYIGNRVGGKVMCIGIRSVARSSEILCLPSDRICSPDEYGNHWSRPFVLHRPKSTRNWDDDRNDERC